MPSADSSKPSAVPIPYTTAALTHSQAAQLTAALLSANSIPRIQAALQHSLQESGWTHALRARALDLLRSGECQTYEELMARVLAETRQPGNSKDGDKEKDGQNGLANGSKNGGGAETGAASSAASIRIPEKAVREGIRAVRKEVENVCEITFD